VNTDDCLYRLNAQHWLKHSWYILMYTTDIDMTGYLDIRFSNMISLLILLLILLRDFPVFCFLDASIRSLK